MTDRDPFRAGIGGDGSLVFPAMLIGTIVFVLMFSFIFSALKLFE